MIPFIYSDMARSGISRKVTDKLKITAHAATADDGAHYRIPYWNTDGSKRAHYNRRYIGPQKTDSEEDGKEQGKELRYRAKKGSSVQAYFNPLMDWVDVLTDSSVPLIITEGEKKAVKATLAGFPCIALMGVGNYANKMQRGDLIKDLTDITWNKRIVYILYDSDVDKPEVRTHLLKLTLRLGRRGADARGGFCPGTETERMGIDDYLRVHTKADFQELLDHLTAYSPSCDNRVMEFGADHLYLTRHNRVLCLDDPNDDMHTWSDLHDRYANQQVTDIDPNTLRAKSLPISQAYQQNAFRADAYDYVLDPSRTKRSVFHDRGADYFNTWRGFKVEPVRGKTEPWDKMLKHLIIDAAERAWFEDWLAHTLQFPAVKMRTTPCVYSAAQGVGKSSVGDVIGEDIFGTYYWPTEQEKLFTKFNGFVGRALFVMGDDLIFKGDNVVYRSAAKTLFERDVNVTEDKNKDQKKVTVRCNFYLTGNDLAAFPLDPTGSNRRFGMLQGPTKRTLPASFYTKEFDRWRKREDGPAHVLYRYLHRSLKGFDPNADAPDTKLKREAVAVSRPEHIAWVVEAYERTGLELATPASLWSRFQAEHANTRVKRGTFFHHLKEQHPESERITRKLHARDANPTIFVILGDSDRWKRATPAELREQLSRQAGQLQDRGGL